VGRRVSDVLAGEFQSEREEETRDRAERGSVVRGSDQASVEPKRTSPARLTGSDSPTPYSTPTPQKTQPEQKSGLRISAPQH
jgi:hypothetical protein